MSTHKSLELSKSERIESNPMEEDNQPPLPPIPEDGEGLPVDPKDKEEVLRTMEELRKELSPSPPERSSEKQQCFLMMLLLILVCQGK